MTKNYLYLPIEFHQAHNKCIDMILNIEVLIRDKKYHESTGDYLKRNTEAWLRVAKWFQLKKTRSR